MKQNSQIHMLGGWGGGLYDYYEGYDFDEDDVYYPLAQAKSNITKPKEKVIPDFKICPVEDLKKDMF